MLIHIITPATNMETFGYSGKPTFENLFLK